MSYTFSKFTFTSEAFGKRHFICPIKQFIYKGTHKFETSGFIISYSLAKLADAKLNVVKIGDCLVKGLPAQV